MNKDRRKRVDQQIERLQQIQEDLQALIDEEEEAFENLPESFQGGEQGARIREALDILDQALSYVNGAEADLSDLTSD